MWIYIFVFCVSLFLLARSAGIAVKALSKIAFLSGWSEFVVSFVLMAFTTTLPELFVGLTASLHKSTELAFGNVMGSNVVHLTLGAAIAVLVGNKLNSRGATIQKTAFFTGILCFLPLVLILDNNLSRIDGLVLTAALIIYFERILSHKKRFDKDFPSLADKKNGRISFLPFFRALGKFLLAVCLLIAASQGIVWATMSLASLFGLSLMTVGAVILGLGTNLPEIGFAVKAVKTGHKSMVLGDIMGAVAVNTGFVLSSALLIHPLRLYSLAPYITGIIFTAAAALAFLFFTRTGRQISKKEGFFLLGLYLLFVFLLIK